MVISWPWQICHLFFRVSNPWIVFGILNFRFLADCLTLEEAYSSLGIPCWHLNWNSVTGIWNSFPQRMRLRRSVTLLCKTKRMKNCKTVLKAFHQFLRIEQSGNEVVLGGRTFQLSIKSSLFSNTLKTTAPPLPTNPNHQWSTKMCILITNKSRAGARSISFWTTLASLIGLRKT